MITSRKSLHNLLIATCLILFSCGVKNERKKISDNPLIYEEMVPSDTSESTFESILYKEGRLFSKTSYFQGLKHGLHEEFYENGNLLERGYYDKGSKIGAWLYFNSDGALMHVRSKVRNDRPNQNSRHDSLINEEGNPFSVDLLSAGRYINLACSCSEIVLRNDTCRFTITVNNPIFNGGTRVIVTHWNMSKSEIFYSDTIFSRTNLVQFDAIMRGPSHYLTQIRVSDLEWKMLDGESAIWKEAHIDLWQGFMIMSRP